MTVSNPEQDAEEPQIAIGAAGEAIAVWDSPRKRRSVVQSASRTPGGEWSAPRTISPPRSFEPHIAVNAAGEAVAIWTHRVGRKTVVQGASRSSAGDWSAPITLSKRPGSPFFDQVSINDAGEAIAVWEDEANDHASLIQVASRSPLGTWSKPVNAFPRVATLDSSGPQIAVTAAGEAVVVWGYLTPKFSGMIQSASRPAGGTWSGPVELAEEPEANGVPEPEVAFNAAGEVVALWEREEDNFGLSLQSASRPPGGAWSRPITVFKRHNHAESVAPQIAIDNAGEAVAVWEGSGPALILSASRPPGGAWSQATRVFRGHRITTVNGYSIVTAGQNSPQIALSSTGEAVTIWDGRDGVIRGASRSPSGAWFPPTRVSRGPVREDFNPEIAIFPTGEAVAVWEHWDGGHTVIQSSSRPPAASSSG